MRSCAALFVLLAACGVPEVDPGSTARGKADTAWSYAEAGWAQGYGFTVGPCTEATFPAYKGFRWSAPGQRLERVEVPAEVEDEAEREFLVRVPWRGDQPEIDLALVDVAEPVIEEEDLVVESWTYLKLAEDEPAATRGRLLAIYGKDDEQVEAGERELQRVRALAFFFDIKGRPPKGKSAEGDHYLCQKGGEPNGAVGGAVNGYCNWLASTDERPLCLDRDAFGWPLKGSAGADVQGVYSQLGPVEGGCVGCDLTERSCVGSTEVGEVHFGLKCVDKPEEGAPCETGRFRQCAEACDQWQLCENEKWGACEAVDDGFVDEDDADSGPGRTLLLARYGPGALTCLTPQVAPERKAPERDAPETAPPSGVTTGDKTKVDIELKYDVDDQPVVKDGVVTFSGEVCNNHETQKVEKVVVELHHITEYLTNKEALKKLEAPLVTKPVTLAPKACEAWTLELSGLPPDGYQYTLNAGYQGIDDPVPGNNRLSAGTDEYTIDKPAGGAGEPTEPAGETAKTLEVKLKAVEDREALEVTYLVQVCSDGPAPAKGIEAGLYLDRDERPDCGDTPDEKWAVVEGERAKNCWTKELPLEAKAKKFEVWAVADVACELIKEGDRGRSASTTVDLRPADERDSERGAGEEEDRGEKSGAEKKRGEIDDDGGCRLVGSARTPPWALLVTLLLARGRRRSLR